MTFGTNTIPNSPALVTNLAQLVNPNWYLPHTLINYNVSDLTHLSPSPEYYETAFGWLVSLTAGGSTWLIIVTVLVILLLIKQIKGIFCCCGGCKCCCKKSGRPNEPSNAARVGSSSEMQPLHATNQQGYDPSAPPKEPQKFDFEKPKALKTGRKYF
jgi:hypothetical protein